jgi:hypothetical protein
MMIHKSPARQMSEIQRDPLQEWSIPDFCITRLKCIVSTNSTLLGARWPITRQAAGLAERRKQWSAIIPMTQDVVGSRV